LDRLLFVSAYSARLSLRLRRPFVSAYSARLSLRLRRPFVMSEFR
jgi:hypothetical protein